MHIYRVTYCPAAGKHEEAVSLLRERLKWGQARDVHPVLSRKVFTPEGGPTYQIGTGFEDIDKWGVPMSDILTRGQDAESVKYFQRIEPLLRSPIQNEMWEVLVPVATPPQVGGYIVRQSVYPLAAHGIEFRSSMIELAKSMHSQGFNVGMYAQYLPHAGAVLQGIFPVNRLSDWEAILARRTPEIHTWIRTYSPLMRKPSEFELWGIVTEPPKI